MINRQEFTLFDQVTPVAITSSTDATPIVITTTTNHGFITGELVMIYGHTTNIAANGIYKIKVTAVNKFSLHDQFTGANIAGSGGGAGAGGIVVPAPTVISLAEFRNIVMQVSTSGTATTTLKIAGSLGMPAAEAAVGPRYGFPNMGATQTNTNPYSFLQVIDLENANAINGNTGIVVAGTDIHKTYEVNINAMNYLTVIPISWTQGKITIKIIIVTNA